jgi:hypothetical protein
MGSGPAVQINTQYLSAQDLQITVPAAYASIIQDNVIALVSAHEGKWLLLKPEFAFLISLSLLDQQA